MRAKIVVGFSTFLLVAPAMAQSVTERDSGLYLHGNVGALWPTDVEFDTSTSLSGTTLSATGEFSFDPGFAVSAGPGYRFNEYIAAEAEVGYGRFTYDSVEGNLTLTNAAGSSLTVSGEADVEGDVSVVSGLVSAVVTPLGLNTVNPFLGVGVGVAHFNDEIDSISSGGTTLQVNSDESRTDFMAQGIGGLDVTVTEAVSLGGQYRLVWVNSGEDGTDDLLAHTFLLNAKLRF